MGTHLIKTDHVKQGKSDWSGYYSKMMSHNKFKLKKSKRFLDAIRNYLFQFGVI